MCVVNGAGVIKCINAPFLTAAFFRAGAGFVAAAFAAAFCKRHRSFVAAIILAIPSLLMWRLGFVAACGAGGSAGFLDAAYLLRCASAIAFRPAALIFRRLPVGASGVAASAGPPARSARSSAILASILAFWNPSTHHPSEPSQISSSGVL